MRAAFSGRTMPPNVTELGYLATMNDAYVRSFEARVTALPPGAVVLDRTYFYPAGGGQLADRGTLTLPGGGTTQVSDVTKSGPSVIHRIARGGRSNPLVVGAVVEGTIDWERRHRHMRLHTAQHLLSARIFSLTGVRTRKAAMAGESGTIDLERPLPPDQSADMLEQDLNDFLVRGLEVRVLQVPRAEWEKAPSARSGLVPLAPQVDPVRVIAIDGADECPCGGTHVRSTAEVGRVAVTTAVPISDGGVRIPFTLSGDAPSTPPA